MECAEDRRKSFWPTIKIPIISPPPQKPILDWPSPVLTDWSWFSFLVFKGRLLELHFFSSKCSVFLTKSFCILLIWIVLWKSTPRQLFSFKANYFERKQWLPRCFDSQMKRGERVRERFRSLQSTSKLSTPNDAGKWKTEKDLPYLPCLIRKVTDTNVLRENA